jgi:diaminopimelate epimerase
MAQFLKKHGLGNDFVIFDARDGALPLTPAQAVKIADRRLGIGCDTVAIIGPGNAAADASVRFINADGSDSDSCGNASRCIADVLMEERGLASVRLMTGAGMVICSRAPGGLVTVDMGAPRLAWNEVPLAKEVDTKSFQFTLEDKTLTAAAVSMGNPHCILFVGDAARAPVAGLGPLIEHHPLFPKRVNVEFAQVLDKSNIRMRVWERGAGITLACGTGACATLVAAARLGLTGRKAQIALDGGALNLEWRADDHVLMTGPVAKVFSGRIAVDRL